MGLRGVHRVRLDRRAADGGAGEFFADPQGTAAGQKVDLWKGLVGRLEYRHDQADTKVFEVRAPGLVGTGKVQETVTAALYYSFF